MTPGNAVRADPVEEREAPLYRIVHVKHGGILKPESVSTKQERIAELARSNPAMALTTLAHHIDYEWVKSRSSDNCCAPRSIANSSPHVLTRGIVSLNSPKIRPRFERGMSLCTVAPSIFNVTKPHAPPKRCRVANATGTFVQNAFSYEDRRLR